MTSTAWIILIAIVAAALAIGWGVGHWIECRGRGVVAEVEAVDPHNLDETAGRE